MKVLLINGSTKKEGNTNYVIEKMEKEFEKNDIETENFWIGVNPILGCLGCNKCKENKRCFIDDNVNKFLNKLEEVEGIIFASPVHFSGIAGMLSSFMDRAFYIKKDLYKNKVVSGVAVQRRAGGTDAIDQMNKYFLMSNTIIATSGYWNSIYGTSKEELEQDLEGMQNLENLVKNMSYILKCMNKANVEEQSYDKPIKTNFIK